MSRRRVAVTGLGLVTPHGTDPAAVFGALFEGRSAIRAFSRHTEAGRFDAIGACIDASSWDAIPKELLATTDRCGALVLAAAESAIADARLDLPAEDTDRLGVSIGTSLGGALSQESAYAQLFADPASRLSPFTLVRVMYNGPAAHLGMRYRLAGPNLTHSETCASSAVAIGEAARKIQHGEADVMLAGGTEAPFAFVSVKAWAALHVLAPARQENVAATCRPFSRDRNGTVLGEGAAVLVLEEWSRARSRNAQIYAEVLGYAVVNDPHHLTQPSVRAQAHAMSAALSDAALDAPRVDYINAHGTATRRNDETETAAIKQVLGAHAHRVAVSSTKSMHGHLVGAAGALEALVTVLALHNQSLPPTAHLDVPDPALDLDYVPTTGRRSRVHHAMSNSFAVGGTAATLVFRRADT